MLAALQAEACRHPNIKLVVVDGNVDVAKQNNDVRDLLARGVDAVLMSPVESGALVPAARAVMSAGSRLSSWIATSRPTRLCLSGEQRDDGGRRRRKNGEGPGRQGNIVVITGLKGSSAAVDRDKGMKNVLAKYPDIKILATGDRQWICDPSVPIMEDFLTAYPKIDAVFSHAEESAWGAQLAVARGNHCKDDIKHYMFGGSNAGFKPRKPGRSRLTGTTRPTSPISA